jgi:hypothetical protein
MFDQSFDVAVEVGVAHWKDLSIGQTAHSHWKYRSRRHLGIVQENRDYTGSASRERQFDLDPHPVIRIIQPAGSPFIPRMEPMVSYHDQDDAAVLKPFPDAFRKIFAPPHRIDIPEYRIARKDRVQALTDSSSGVPRILPSIADKNASGRRLEIRLEL